VVVVVVAAAAAVVMVVVVVVAVVVVVVAVVAVGAAAAAARSSGDSVCQYAGARATKNSRQAGTPLSPTAMQGEAQSSRARWRISKRHKNES
jgi:hypothetical protein